MHTEPRNVTLIKKIQAITALGEVKTLEQLNIHDMPMPLNSSLLTLHSIP